MLESVTDYVSIKVKKRRLELVLMEWKQNLHWKNFRKGNTDFNEQQMRKINARTQRTEIRNIALGKKSRDFIF